MAVQKALSSPLHLLHMYLQTSGPSSCPDAGPAPPSWNFLHPHPSKIATLMPGQAVYARAAWGPVSAVADVPEQAVNLHCCRLRHRQTGMSQAMSQTRSRQLLGIVHLADIVVPHSQHELVLAEVL